MAAPADFDQQLVARERKTVLRCIVCGSVGDGKSTLVDRLIHDCGAIHEDLVTALEVGPRISSIDSDEVNRALPPDALIAAREQGVTSDVVYRAFNSGTRTFVVADAPDNQRYTRNMVVGASMSDVAVVVVDARKGVLPQTRRYTFIASLLGIRYVVVAINKLDLVPHARSVIETIEKDCRALGAELGLQDLACVPVSASTGANVAVRSAQTPWYRGPTLLDCLDTVRVDDDVSAAPFRLSVQLVGPNQDDRGVAGVIVSGSVEPGDRIRALPSGCESAIERIVTTGGHLPRAVAGNSCTVTLADDIDVVRGDVLCAAASPPEVADQMEATIIWMHDEKLLPGRRYRMKIGTRTAGVSFAAPKHKIDAATMEHLAARTLHRNEIAVCNLNIEEAIPFEPYRRNRALGGFIVVDRATDETLGAGVLHFALRRSHNIHWQAVAVGKRAHAALKGHRPCIVWFTGLSGAGKSTIANLVQQKLHALGCHTHLLDGDNIRHGLSKDLGFTEADRVENIRRMAEVARLMVDAGLIVLVAFISPFRAERELARELVGQNEFCEVHVDVPLELAERRDPKGLYAKARRGELANFTGIDSPYEPPQHPEVRIDGASTSPDAAAERVIAELRRMGVMR